MIGRARDGKAPHVKIRLDVKAVPGLKSSTVWGSFPGTTDETIYVIAHRDGWFEGSNDNGTGVATMIGLAEYFAKIPKEQRRRTIYFLGTTGHHDGTAESGAWLRAAQRSVRQDRADHQLRTHRRHRNDPQHGLRAEIQLGFHADLVHRRQPQAGRHRGRRLPLFRRPHQ